MDIIDKERKIISEIIDIYAEDTNQKHLENIAKTIADRFREILVEKGEGFGLISKNSVRDIKLFSVIHRIKEPDSLKEKFYRGNLLKTRLKDLKLKNGKQVRDEKGIIIKELNKLDDIIGVKILTDLNRDCGEVLSLIREFEKWLQSNDIFLDSDDLGSQPEKMLNGLDIYKIKGVYIGKYHFELQIKSKIISAWGDMEHSIFYKDYFVSPVRESTQATMNHIGKLLFQIDDFLLSIRSANKDYEKKAEVTAFLSWFDRVYSPKIRTKLGVGFKIDSISEALFYFKENCIIEKSRKEAELHFEHFSFKPSTAFLRMYVGMRDKYFEIKILEAIVFAWMWYPHQITKKNIDAKLDAYLERLIEFLSARIQERLAGFEKNELTKMIISYWKQLLRYNPSPQLLLSVDGYVRHLKFIQFLNDDIDSKFEKIIDYLDPLYLNLRFKGNGHSQIQEMKLDENDRELLKEFLLITLDKVKKRRDDFFDKERKLTAEIINLL